MVCPSWLTAEKRRRRWSAAPGIEGACRLVRQHQPRRGDQRPGRGGPLFLPARNLIGVLLQNVRDFQLLGQRRKPRRHFLIPLSLQDEGQKDIVLQGKGVEKVEVLENKAEVIPTESGDLFFPDGDEIFALKEHLAARRLVEGGEDIEQGGFARAGFAHDGDVFPSSTEKETLERACTWLPPKRVVYTFLRLRTSSNAIRYARPFTEWIPVFLSRYRQYTALPPGAAIAPGLQNPA